MPEDLQQQILDTIQSGFPIEENPYGVLAQACGTDVAAVKDVLANLYSTGSVRRIGASFDSRKLGYTSTLCALAVPGGRAELQKAADVVSTFPGVTHNYGRAHRYNLWFTLITRSEEAKQVILESIKQQTGCDDLLDMPSTRKFKISVDFGRQRAHSAGAAAQEPKTGATAIEFEGASEPAFNAEDPFDIALVRWAQADIARDAQGQLFDDPFVAGVQQLNQALNRDDIDLAYLLVRLRQLKANRTIRRFGAMVRHHKIGFAFNSMTVWDIPDDEVAKAGELFAAAPFVSHCYTRPRQETWPANLYAMTHAQTKEEMQANVDALQRMLSDESITCNQHFALETTDEFKKISMSYFLEDA